MTPRPLNDDPPESTLDPEALQAQLSTSDGVDDPTWFDQLGRGAGGVVWAGPDRHLARTVAWKVARGARAKARLAHEARVLAAIEHPAIVPIHDLVETDDDALRIALRIVRGETLHTLSRTGDLNARMRLVRPFLQAVEAVAWAHRLGWVHRDLKPANIMIGEFGETQVIDWGLAVSLDDAPEDAPGAIMGTPASMSPEQARGESVSPSFDVWGLGATLFELVTAHPLQTRTSDPDGLEALLGRVRRGERPRVVDVCPEAPAELVAIIERCLAPTPDARYPDASALAADLAAFLEGRRVAAHEYTAWQLMRRFVRAWRLPLGVALAVLVTGVVAASVAVHRISAERDEVVLALSERDQEIAERGVVEALRELADGQRPEAELAAARALAVRESPEARGVAMAYERTPRPKVAWTRALPFDCIDLAVAPDASHTLCGTRESLVVLDGERPIWSFAAPYRGARFIDGGALVLVDPTRGPTVALAVADGAVVRTYPATSCEGLLIGDPAQTSALSLGHVCADLIDARGASSLNPCASTHIEVAAIGSPDSPGQQARVAGLCIGGDLFVIASDGARRRIPTAIGRRADMLLAGALLGDQHMVVGSSGGELHVLDLADGHIIATRTVLDGIAIRTIETDTASDRLIVTGDGIGPLLMIASTLTPLMHLPRSERSVAFLHAAGLDLVSYGDTLTGWALQNGPPAHFDGLGGVTSASLEAAGLVVTHDAALVVLDPSDGAALAEATWDRAIAKQAVILGRRVLVAIAGRGTGEPLLSERAFGMRALEPEELPRTRRVLPLTGGRLVMGKTGSALTYAPASDAQEVEVVAKLVLDVATRGDVVAVLFDRPREIVLYDMGTAPIVLGHCSAPSATAVAVGLVAPLDPEPTVLAVTPSAILAYRIGDWLSASECSIVGLYNAPRAVFTRVAMTNDGRYVAGGASDGQVHLWQADGTRIASVPAHVGAVTTLTVDAEQRWFVSGAWDGRVGFHAIDALALGRDTVVDRIHAAWRRIR